MEVVELIVKMGHVIGIVLGVVLVGGVEDKPLPQLELCSQQVHVLLVR